MDKALTQPIRVVQVSDCHLFADTEGKLLGLNTQFSLDQVLELVAREQPDIDLILATGDLSQDASLAAYERLRDALSQFDAPTYWIEGNHDPGPLDLPGTHRAEVTEGGLVFRHIATPAAGEVSGHYHPKARLGLRGGSVTRPCFLVDRTRIILPAFGTYTGGLKTTAPELETLMGPEALAILTGKTAHAIPMPRRVTNRKAS